MTGIAVPSLIGRDVELAQIDRVVSGARSSSAALAVVGDAGLGKSALLAAATAHAGLVNTLVLHAVGVEAESELVFAGLHQLLRPVSDLIERLPARQAAALRSAFGMGDAATPDRFLIGLATLTLLAEAAEQQPVLVLVDDAHWFDQGSLDALAFAIRRLRAERIGVLVASRSRELMIALGEQVALLELSPLDPPAAANLLDRKSNALRGSARSRVLEEAAGNPLALIELASIAGDDRLTQGGGAFAALPLTERLERVFSARLVNIPDATRQVLLLAACADANELRPLLQAAEGLGIGADALQAAERAGLVVILNGGEFAFRHPLQRSVVYQSATFAERRAAHLALARALAADPERRAWHLAAVAVQPDESIAALLQETAERSRLRGGFAAAASALERAAALSPEPSDAARRLTRATQMAFAAGRLQWVLALAQRVHAVSGDPRLRAVADQQVAQIQALAGTDAEVPEALSPASLEAVMAEAPEVGVRRIVVAAGYAFLAGDAELREVAYQLAQSIPGRGDEEWRLFVLAAGNPGAHRATIATGIRKAIAHQPDQLDLDKMLAHVPWFADDSASAVVLLGRVVDEMRRRGDIGALGTYLALLGFTFAWRDRWLDARAIAAEAMQLGSDIQEPNSEAMGCALDALVTALQGEMTTARERASVALSKSRAGLVVSVATWSLGLNALAAGRVTEAYEYLSRMFASPGREAHFQVSSWAIADLAESAILSGKAAEITPIVDERLRQAEQGISVRALLVARRASALLRDDETSAMLFDQALGGGGAEDWPFEFARTQLSYGEWLRRRRHITLARPQLRAALDAFSRLGARPWIERTQGELRAAGVTLESRPPAAVDELTPQERQIAQLAARGMTNREIGAALFLSPRTVGFHLHNVFPKLNVTTRAQLAHLLSPQS
jgi:DNA-binding CsgD family transcriptional regulator